MRAVIGAVGSALIALLSLPAAAADSFCLLRSDGQPQCSRSVGGSIRIDPAETERDFVWRSSDGGILELGTIPAGKSEVRIPAAAHSVTMVFRQGSAFSKWPQPIDLAIANRSSSRKWQIALEGRDALKPHTIRLPPGPYELTATAPHHRRLRDTFAIQSSDVNFGSRTLVATPTITGSVTASDGSPLAGVFVRADASPLIARTDMSGSFRLEVEDEWPKQLRLAYPGLSELMVDVPRAERDSSLGRLVMSRGGKIVVTVSAMPPQTKIRAELRRPKLPGEPVIVADKAIDSVSKSVAFENLTAGKYDVLLRGTQPLQQIAMKADVSDDKVTEIAAKIEPLEVTLEVLLGKKPMPNAALTVSHMDSRWSAALNVDDRGRLVTEAWQRGKYFFVVTGPGDRSPFAVVKDVDAQYGQQISIIVPERRISGVVVDASTGQPIAEARVRLESQNSDGGAASIGTATDADGRFAFSSLLPGTHTITAAADRYVTSDATTVRLDEGDASAGDLRLTLEAATGRKVAVTNRSGAPVAGATIMHVVGSRVENTYRTDTLGQALIGFSDAPSLLFTIPREGSLAITRISASVRSGEPLPIVVPDAAASLQIRAVDESGKGIPGVRFLIRIDGEVIPPDATAQIAAAAGFTPYTDVTGLLSIDNLPTGFYELWPLRTAAEAGDIMATLSSEAPVQVPLRPGVNQAILTFSRKRM